MTLVQGTPEWHEFRRKHIGASDSPVIMGVSPFKDVKRLYIEKTDLFPTNSEENFFMRRGLALEPEALAVFETETGYMMMPKVLVHPKIEYMAASLDGIELDGRAFVEIKCPGKKDHECALDGQIPEKYRPQLQHQIEVTGLNKGYYFSYSPESDQPFKILEIYKDEEYTKKMLEEEANFWRCVIEKTPPISKNTHFKTIKDPKFQQAVYLYRDCLCRHQESAVELEKAKLAILEIANEEEIQGFGLKAKKILKKGTIDYGSIEELKNIDLEKYRKPTTNFWKIELT